MIRKFQNANFMSPRIVQATLGTMLMFGVGSSFAFSVFIPAVEAAADPPNSLNGIWEAGMGTMHFLSAPAMIIASIFLDGGSLHVVDSKYTPSFSFTTVRARFLCFISLLCYACFALSAFGSAFSSSAFLFSGVALQGLPLAIVYLVCIEASIAWFPERSGFVVGCAEMAFGMGTIVLTYVFSKFITGLNQVSAIFLTSCVLVATAVLPCIFLRWPSEGEVRHLAGLAGLAGLAELQPLNQPEEDADKIKWYDLVKLPNFWFYTVAVFATGATYMFNPYFFKLGPLFGANFDQLVFWFNFSNLISTIIGLFGTAMTDYVGFGSGFWFSGAKNVSLMLMLMQCVALMAMTIITKLEIFWGFVIIKTLLKIVGVCHLGNSAILARDLFGPKNGCIVFGFGAGLSLGSGEGLSALIMASIEAMKGQLDTASDYNSFFWISTVWTILGLACLLATYRQSNSKAAMHNDCGVLA